MLDRDGDVLKELPPGGLPGAPRSRRTRQCRPCFADAFIASEDRRFEWHPGVDPLAIVRAAASNLRSGRVVSGASTLTQQLARLLVPRRRTLAGKAFEALWAVRLTAHLSRDDILRAYLDRVALGHDLVGVEAASRPTSVDRAHAVGRAGRAPRRHRPLAGAGRPLAGPGAAAGAGDAGGARPDAPGRTARRRSWRGSRSAADLDLVAPARAFGAPHLVVDLAGRLEHARARPGGGGPDHARPGAPA